VKIWQVENAIVLLKEQALKELLQKQKLVQIMQKQVLEQQVRKLLEQKIVTN
jgi:hypothetical protein